MSSATNASASMISVQDWIGLQRLCDYLDRVERPRPVAVTDGPRVGCFTKQSARLLCQGNGIDVIVLDGDGLVERLSERLGEYRFWMQQGSTRFFSPMGSVAKGDVDSTYVYFDHNNPSAYGAFVVKAIDDLRSGRCSSLMRPSWDGGKPAVFHARASRDEIGAKVMKATATVTGVIDTADRALAACELEGRKSICAVSAEEVRRLSSGHAGRSLPMSRLFAPGMRLDGVVDPETKTFSGYAPGCLRDLKEALSNYREGMTVLVRVADFVSEGIRVELFPGVVASVSANDACEEGEVPASRYRIGQVVPAFVAGHDDRSGEWLLSLRDASVDSIEAAPSILLGGPAWLAPEDFRAASHERSVSADDLKRLGLPLDLDASLLEPVAQIVAKLERYDSEIGKLHAELARAKEEGEARERVRSASEREDSAAEGCNLRLRWRSSDIKFCSEEDRRSFELEKLDFQLHQLWLMRYEPAERARHPLPVEWRYADEFLDSLGEAAVRLDKLLRCMIDVLLGNLGGGRKTHALRNSDAADGSQRMTKDGDRIWRCSVEEGRPQAARLHFARSSDGTITFLSVRNHDDFRS